MPIPTLKDAADQVEVRKAFSDLSRVLEKKIVGEKTGSDPARGLYVENTEGPNAQEIAAPGTIPIRDDNGALAGNITGNAPTTTLAANSTLFGGKSPANFVLDYIYPVGCYYTQYPDASSNTDATEFPEAQRPATLFGGTWAEQWADESITFSTRGTLSDDDRVDGLQADAMQQITGELGLTTNCGFSAGARSEGAFSQNPNNTLTFTAQGVANTAYGMLFDSADSPNARTADVTRMRNRRIKVWKRTA